MWTRHHKRRNTGRLIVPVIAILVMSYFGFHAYRGEYGINAKQRLELRTEALETELAGLRKRRGALEERLRLVKDGSLEKDMLDEQARRALNFAQENEVVIFYSGDQ